MSKFLILSFVALVYLAACGPDNPPPLTNGARGTQVVEHEATSIEELLPLAEGNSWTYDVVETVRNAEGQTGQASVESTLKVQSVNRTDAGVEATIESIGGEDGAVSSQLLFLITETALLQKGVRGRDGTTLPFTPAIPLIEWPFEAGKETKWEGTGYRPGAGGIGPIAMTMEHRGLHEVDTLAGRMRAYRVDNERTFTANGVDYVARQHLYFVPKVGLIRVVETVTDGTAMRQHEMKLKSYTVQ